MGTLEGRPALVTGAGQGIGRGIALALAAHGATIGVLDRNADTAADTCAALEARGAKGVAVQCDVRNLDEIERAVDEVVSALGPVRILVNNAQSGGIGTILDLGEDEVDTAWRSGPLAALRFMRACHEHLRDGGAIVNISSNAALYAGAPGLSAYAATKAALQTFSRAAAVEWGADGIRVNAILPLVASPSMLQWHEENPDASAKLLADIPTGRTGDAETDVGRLVAFLVGPDAGMITGATIPVDGGMSYVR